MDSVAFLWNPFPSMGMRRLSTSPVRIGTHEQASVGLWPRGSERTRRLSRWQNVLLRRGGHTQRRLKERPSRERPARQGGPDSRRRSVASSRLVGERLPGGNEKPKERIGPNEKDSSRHNYPPSRVLVPPIPRTNPRGRHDQNCATIAPTRSHRFTAQNSTQRRASRTDTARTDQQGPSSVCRDSPG